MSGADDWRDPPGTPDPAEAAHLPGNGPGSGAPSAPWAVPGVPLPEPADSSGATSPGAQVAADALAALADGIDSLVELGDAGDLLRLDEASLVDLVREFETARNRMQTIDHRLAHAIDESRIWARHGARTPAAWLSRLLKISPRAARLRFDGADELLDTSSWAGSSPAALPDVAAAVRRGELNDEQLPAVYRCIRELRSDPELPTEAFSAAEAQLIKHARSFGPADLNKLASKIVDVCLPEGTEPKDRLAHERRQVFIGPLRGKGTATLHGTLNATARENLLAVLGPLSAPKPATRDADGVIIARDERTAAQRMHDALEDACLRLLRSGSLPDSGGSPATVHVHIGIDDLLRTASYAPSDATSDGTDGHAAYSDGAADRRSGRGRGMAESDREGEGARRWEATSRGQITTTDGTRLSMAQLIRLAAEADIIPTYLDATGNIVCYGRARRTASAAQTQALIGRDGGCSFPGCDSPPAWCERHHIVPWLRGGQTDLDNLTLLCIYHHRWFEFAGWACRLVGGLPHWVPPAHIDPERRPLLHYRIARLHPRRE